MTAPNWIDLRHHEHAAIETLRAHFEGHAYDPHWHDTYLLGYTEQGVQQFDCRRTRLHSTPGQVIMLEPGDIHDGHAPSENGFTYSMLYLEPDWLTRALRTWSEAVPATGEPHFPATLAEDGAMTAAIERVFKALRDAEPRIVKEAAIDALLEQVSRHLSWRVRPVCDPRVPALAQRARDYLHAHMHDDVGLDELATICGVDRFRLSRVFKASYGLAPHAYLIQLRLAQARRWLASGTAPAEVAHALGFADQSHLGRWFRRAYGLTPASYGKRCTNVPDFASHSR